MTTERIPFDLERALAGDALVTRGGLKVTNFRLADISDTRYPYKATIHTPGYKPNAEWFAEGGRFYADNVGDSPNDLFMAENDPVTPEREYIYRLITDGVARLSVYTSVEAATAAAEKIMADGDAAVVTVLRVERTLRRKVTTEWSDE